ncbi:nuclear transport factor 2 family protein [Kribbella sp. NPDC051718]|uniref:nuclear transport factor 2 family protein n=1 Tax=Kribbella sp. NPDC051718 TaxID=3155168 RepID=UPI00341CFA4C
MTDREAIEALILTYAALVDAGDFEGVGALLSQATYAGATTVTGQEAITENFHNTVILHPDGTPRTRHIVTNFHIKIDEDAGTATSRSTFTTYQALRNFPLQPIAVGHYDDTFTRTETTWHFTTRQVTVDLAGNLTRHIRS